MNQPDGEEGEKKEENAESKPIQQELESPPVSDTSSLSAEEDEEPLKGNVAQIAGKVVEEILNNSDHLVALTEGIGMVMMGQPPEVVQEQVIVEKD